MKSYTRTIKENLCEKMLAEVMPVSESKKRTPPYCCASAFLAGFLFFSAKIGEKGIRFKCENNVVLDLCAYMLLAMYGIEITPRESKNRGRFTVSVENEEDCVKLLETFSAISGDNITKDIFSCGDCRGAFIRGCFVASGTVINPEKGYHLEMVDKSRRKIENLAALLEKNDLPPKIIKRKDLYVLYYKDSEKIEDFLMLIGARDEAFGMIETKMENNIRKDINRISNFDSANFKKTLSSAEEEINAIKKIKGARKFSSLPEPLKVTAKFREKYPEMPLLNLAEIHEPKISKSGLNHRRKKLIEIAKDL